MEPSGDTIPAAGPGKGGIPAAEPVIASTRPAAESGDIPAASCGAACADWFQPSLGRAEAERQLAGRAPGTFLVRASLDNPGCFRLSVAGSGKLYNYLIRSDGSTFQGSHRAWLTFAVHYQLSSSHSQPLFGSLGWLP